MLQIVIYVLMLVLGGVLIYAQTARTLRCTEDAIGTVTGFQRAKYSSGKYRRRRKYPVVEYTVEDTTYQQMADVCSLRYKVGTELEIRYNREKPEEFIVKTRSLLSALLSGGLLIVLGAMGLILNFAK